MIHTVPRKQGFCSIYTFSCWPIFSVLLFNFPVTVPKPPITTGINSTFFYFHIQPTSYFSSSYSFCFLSFLFHTRVSNGLNGSISPLQLWYLASIVVLQHLICFYGKVRQNDALFWFKYLYSLLIYVHTIY